MSVKLSFLMKEERKHCWEACGHYWDCLNTNNIQIDDNKGGPCAELRKCYQTMCSTQWVKHFDKKRNYLQFKEKIEKDGIPEIIQNKDPNHPKIFQKRRVYTEIAY